MNYKSGFFSSGTGGGGGGNTNPTNGFMPYNNNGTFDDSYWFVGSNLTNTKTTKGGSVDYGFGVDYSNQVSWMGDYFEFFTYNFIRVDNNIGKISTSWNLISDFGIIVEDGNTYLGSIGGNSNRTSLVVNDFIGNAKIYTRFGDDIFPVKGLYIDFTNGSGEYIFGISDVTFDGISINNGAFTIGTQTNGYITVTQDYCTFGTTGTENLVLNIDSSTNQISFVKNTISGNKIPLIFFNPTILQPYPIYYFGEYNSTYTSSYCNFFVEMLNNESSRVATILPNSAGFGFSAFVNWDVDGAVFYLGTWDATSFQNTYLAVDDSNQRFILSDNLNVNITPLAQVGYLRIRTNNSTYYIRIVS